ncbi:MAG: DUF47 domain-containing protein [Candidatus Bathyarchaeia archaeon]
MSELIEWFRRRRAEKVIEISLRHTSLATSIADTFLELYESALEKKQELVNAHADRIDEMEREADSLRRDTTEELTVGDLDPTVREDFYRLARQVDNIIDWITAGTRNMRILPLDRLPRDMGEIGLKMASTARDCVWATRKCVGRLFEAPREAIELTREVERLEHDVDELFADSRSRFKKVTPAELSTGSAIILYDLFKDIERAADSCEDVSDLVRLLALRIVG